jgi:hypothetical protein
VLAAGAYLVLISVLAHASISCHPDEIRLFVGQFSGYYLNAAGCAAAFCGALLATVKKPHARRASTNLTLFLLVGSLSHILYIPIATIQGYPLQPLIRTLPTMIPVGMVFGFAYGAVLNVLVFLAKWTHQRADSVERRWILGSAFLVPVTFLPIGFYRYGLFRGSCGECDNLPVFPWTAWLATATMALGMATLGALLLRVWLRQRRS